MALFSPGREAKYAHEGLAAVMPVAGAIHAGLASARSSPNFAAAAFVVGGAQALGLALIVPGLLTSLSAKSKLTVAKGTSRSFGAGAGGAITGGTLTLKF